MKLIDTHCHLCHGRLRPQAEAALQRAAEAGVVGVICAAADLEESLAAAGLAGGRDDVWCMAGVHPHEAKDVPADYLQRLEALAPHPRNVAIGEIGLDYHYNFSPPAQQRRVFAEQLALAGRLGKKVVVHSREAFDDTLAVLRDSPVDAACVLLHSCTEGADNLARAMELGAMVSFSGIVTFSKSDELRAAAAMAPSERILVETDAPFLSPEPVRKVKTNEPANVVHVASCLARIRGMALEQLAEITTANAVRFFGL